MKSKARPHSTEVPESPGFARAQIDPGKLILHARDVETLVVYEWSENGVQRNSFGDQDMVVPDGAARLELQLYNFPTGQLRKLYFAKGTRTPWHANHDDIILYGLDAHQLEFVGNQTFHSRPGDATLHPSGVDHHSETIVAGTRVEFAFEAQNKSGRDLIALRGTDMALHKVSEWVVGGQRRQWIDDALSTPQRRAQAMRGKSMHEAGQYRARMFYFPAYTMIEMHLPKGQRLERHKNASEKLLYVLRGKLRVTTERITDVVGPGAMVRMASGKTFAREALARSVVLELEASVTPQPYPRHE